MLGFELFITWGDIYLIEIGITFRNGAVYIHFVRYNVLLKARDSLRGSCGKVVALDDEFGALTPHIIQIVIVPRNLDSIISVHLYQF